MYMPNPRDVIQAIDAVSGDLLWEHRRPQPDDLAEYVTIGTTTNRNIAIYDRLIINTSTDDYIFALDAVTGRRVWETQILDYQVNPAHQTSGPIIAGGRVVSGRGCMPAGGPEACVITAHDPLTGRELWRTQLIPRPGEPGYETWGDVPYEQRGHVGSWIAPAYDPELDPRLRRHLGDLARAEVHARGDRPDPPVPQLDARAGRRHRRDRLALPAPERPLGTSTTPSSACWSTRPWPRTPAR